MLFRQLPQSQKPKTYKAGTAGRGKIPKTTVKTVYLISRVTPLEKRAESKNNDPLIRYSDGPK